MAAELPRGTINIAYVEFDNVPIGNDQPVGDYFRLPTVKEEVLERFGVAQEYLRRKGYPPLAVVDVDYKKRPRWFWAYSEDGSVGFVYRPTRANPDAFEIVRAGRAVHLPRNGVVELDDIKDVAALAVEARERDRREDAQLALDMGRLDMGGGLANRRDFAGFVILEDADEEKAAPAAAEAEPIEIERMNLEQLKQAAADNHIELPTRLKRDAYLHFLLKTLAKLDERREHPFRIIKDDKCLALDVNFFILVKNYFHLSIKYNLASLKSKDRREFYLGYLQTIGLVVIEGTGHMRDRRVAFYSDELETAIRKEQSEKDDIASYLESEKDKVANRTLDIVMSKKIIPASPITFQQLHDALEPSGPYTAIYSRWEVAADKNAALAYLYQMIVDHDMKSKKMSREDAVVLLNR
jgi:hypothetical protein